MVENAAQIGEAVTYGNDPRITRVGRLLRRTKIDELPQFINVLKGDMSLVGPRPEVRKYVELFRKDYEEILQLRPGITDVASLKYQDEAELLGTSGNPEEDYVKKILPDKLKLAKDYVHRASLTFDIGLILKTLPRLIGCRIRNV
jgi:lipopolysaccharide/colanic/teichoic acid biosynthesis glycosyltransferase